MNIKKARSSAMLVLTALIWGVAFVAQSVGMDYVGPFTFNAARFLTGGIVLIPFVFILKKKNFDNKKVDIAKVKQRKKIGIAGGIVCGVALCVASAFQQIGVSYTTVGKAGFITSLYIVVVPILGIFMRKRVPVLAFISVGVATIGMYLLCITEGFAIGRGDFFVLLCAVAFSVHILVVDHFSPKADGVFMSCIQFFTAGVISLVVMFIVEKPELSAIIDCAVPILYAGVMSCGIGYTLQVVAQKDTAPVIASLLMSLESVFSVIAGFVILGQTMTSKELVGCGLVFCGIVLAQLPEFSKKAVVVRE